MTYGEFGAAELIAVAAWLVALTVLFRVIKKREHRELLLLVAWGAMAAMALWPLIRFAFAAR